MEDTLASYQGPQETVQELIQLALRGGGPDNITCIVADVLDVDEQRHPRPVSSTTPRSSSAPSPRTRRQLGDDDGAMQTPGGPRRRTRPQHRPVRADPDPGEGFGPPGSGDTWPAACRPGSFGAYTDEDFVKPPRRPQVAEAVHATSRSSLAVVGGGLYGGYRWTQTQYYVGRQRRAHRALPRHQPGARLGISSQRSTRTTPRSNSSTCRRYQRKQVRETIAASSVGEARDKVDELEEQAKVCRIVAEERVEPPKDEGSKKDEQNKPDDAGLERRRNRYARGVVQLDGHRRAGSAGQTNARAQRRRSVAEPESHGEAAEARQAVQHAAVGGLRHQ